MKHIIALLLLAAFLAACDGDIASYPTSGAMGEAVCPPGQHVAAYGDHGVIVCAY